MSRRLRRWCLPAAVACALAVSACGVAPEDEPQLIEESTQQPPEATPSFDTEQSPVSSGSVPTTESSTSSSPPPSPPPSPTPRTSSSPEPTPSR